MLLAVLSFLLLAANPSDVVAELEANGYYVEPGSTATEEVVSDAVFEARSDGGRLYMAVLATEPPGGAPTFSDSVLDQLGDGYVVTVAPETVGWAGDGSFWSADEMNDAIDASLSGSSDDMVVELFISELTGSSVVTTPDGEEPVADDGGGSVWIWLVVIIGGAALVFFLVQRSSSQRAEKAAARLEDVKAKARDKLSEIADDIIEMEDEVELSGSGDIKAHYQRASATYTEALAQTETATDAGQMIEVIRKLDMAIWELDAAEALLDGKPVPEKPKPPEDKVRAAVEPETETRRVEQDDLDVDRRPQRHSSYAGGDLMTALWAVLAMSGRGRGGWGGGMPGGFGGPMGGGRMGGGGRRSGGMGRMRGGGRRR